MPTWYNKWQAVSLYFQCPAATNNVKTNVLGGGGSTYKVLTWFKSKKRGDLKCLEAAYITLKTQKKVLFGNNAHFQMNSVLKVFSLCMRRIEILWVITLWTELSLLK